MEKITSLKEALKAAGVGSRPHEPAEDPEILRHRELVAMGDDHDGKTLYPQETLPNKGETCPTKK